MDASLVDCADLAEDLVVGGYRIRVLSKKISILLVLWDIGGASGIV
jgi:hypothetical protein